MIFYMLKLFLTKSDPWVFTIHSSVEEHATKDEAKAPIDDLYF